jgi:hypothetical protein
MQALNNEQRIDRLETNVEKLEKKVDDGFAEMRAEFRAIRAEFRGEIGSINRTIHSMWLAMILGFAAILIQNHL